MSMSDIFVSYNEKSANRQLKVLQSIRNPDTV